jgi:hypothetical protein
VELGGVAWPRDTGFPVGRGSAVGKDGRRPEALGDEVDAERQLPCELGATSDLPTVSRDALSVSAAPARSCRRVRTDSRLTMPTAMRGDSTTREAT